MVSVLMGVYHPSHETSGLDIAVASILAQSFSDIELLICDDGSSAEVTRLLDGHAARDERVVLLRGSGAISLPAKLNVCLAAARGEYLARMDADDVSCLMRFEKQVAFLVQHSEIAFVGCAARLFGGGEVGERRFPALPTPWDFRVRMPFLHPTLMLRAEALRAAGGYSTDKYAVLCEDYELLLRLYAMGYRGANLAEVLFLYCVSPDDYKKRRYRHRVNEAVTRWRRFRVLGMLPRAIFWVSKPLLVGVLPHPVVGWLRSCRNKR